MRSRIELTDSAIDIVSKMSDGNPGAIHAMMEILKESPTIDPQGFMGGFGSLLGLDTHRIYGTDIYVLFNDKCDRDVRKMCILLRAVQLGFRSEHWLRSLAGDQMRVLEINDTEWLELDGLVCDRLDEFKKPEKQPA